ncbi:MAG: TIGR03560 family F420-dependent LLM class oxidoreductase [Dehalococcoidia bacterium]|nr:TIGR03560 family F420-dependent LLM class oxidoreductase [Dehalococcoidia bacterium]
MNVGLMVEGQNGLTWERWSHILALAERLRFPSVFRSDHYFIGPQQDSLEAYLSFAIAAKETSTIRFGPLVSPVTFRSPVDQARMAAQIDVLSGGRFVMGMGAGWNEAEHNAYGIPFPPLKERFDRLEESIKVHRALWTSNDANVTGRYYNVAGANCLPRPAAGRPPLLIGGGGEKRTLRLVARYADEWNSVNVDLETYRRKQEVLERHCEAEGRDPATIRRSMMVFAVVGPDEASLHAGARRIMSMRGVPADTDPRAFMETLRARGIAGTTGQVVEQLGRLAEAGLQEIMFQHFNFDSDLVPEYLAAEIAPRVKDF